MQHFMTGAQRQQHLTGSLEQPVGHGVHEGQGGNEDTDAIDMLGCKPWCLVQSWGNTGGLLFFLFEEVRL